MQVAAKVRTAAGVRPDRHVSKPTASGSMRGRGIGIEATRRWVSAKSIGVTTIGFAEVLPRLAPDLILIAGDRFELLAAAQAALVARIPIAHIAGGDTTEGAYDEAIRHSLTKMSHLHFVTNERARQRVVQLGENPAQVFNFGSPGLDFIREAKLLTREELAVRLGLRFQRNNVLVTFHPATLEPTPPADQMRELLAALGQLAADVGIIITMPNADGDGRVLRGMIDAFVAEQHGRAAAMSRSAPWRT